MTKYVMHDEWRWRVATHDTVDGVPFYVLERRLPGKHVRPLRIWARVTECTPDQHERVRTLRDEDAVLRYNVTRGIVTIAAPRSRRKISTTLGGLLAMALRQKAINDKRERDFKRRTRKVR